MDPVTIIRAHQAGETIPWCSCSKRTIIAVIEWADRCDYTLLRKARAALRRQEDRDA